MSDAQNPRHNVRCKVVGNALAKSKEKQTPSVRIRLRTIPGANPVFEGVNDERDLWTDLWLTENALESTIETLEKTLGWQGKSFAELNEPCFEDVEVVAVCEWEENNGKFYEKVLFLNRPGGGGVKKLDDTQVKDVVVKLDAMLMRRRQNSPGAVPAKGTAKPAANVGRPVAGSKKEAPAGVNDFPGYAPPPDEAY